VSLQLTEAERTELQLTEAERTELRRLLRRRGVGQALAQRIRIVLACAEPGATSLGMAGALGVSRPTVATWRGRFAEHRLEGLVDAPRSGAPRTIGDEAVERLVAPALKEMPKNATHWSTRSMARRAGISQTAVPRIWRAFGLRPRRADTFTPDSPHGRQSAGAKRRTLLWFPSGLRHLRWRLHATPGG
jgi:transposase